MDATENYHSETLKPVQRINHRPRSNSISRKKLTMYRFELVAQPGVVESVC